MASWTIDQVGEWLKANDFDKYVEKFKNEDVDGVALFGLQDNDVVNLLSIKYEDGTTRLPTVRTQRKFREKLEAYRIMVRRQRKKRRKTTATTNKTLDVHQSNYEDNSSAILSQYTSDRTDDADTYSKVFTVELKSSAGRFLQNEFVASNLGTLFLTQHQVKCHIPARSLSKTENPLRITLSGVREDVKTALSHLQSLMSSIKTKIFNDSDHDKKVVRWAKHIFSDSAFVVLQKIFFDKKHLTAWEKTHILSGFYVVHYISGQQKFGVSEDALHDILNSEVSFAKDILISNVSDIQPRFRQELDEFIRDKRDQQLRHQTMAIIYRQYPSQTDMKINLFGSKSEVALAKQQIKSLINKHRMRTQWLGLDSTQCEQMLDNYVHELKCVELNYKDDNVRIRIRENSLSAPQYLVTKIKQLVHSMICPTIALTFQYVKNAIQLTEHDHSMIKSLARSCHCELDQIDSRTKRELIALPRRESSSASRHLIQESTQFHSSLSIWRKIFVSNHSIEIQKSYDLTVDLTIMSAAVDVSREGIDPKDGSGFFESNTGKRILYIEWPQAQGQDGDSAMNESIKMFISTSLKQIAMNNLNIVKTIAFSTTNWENHDNRKQFVERLVNETISQLESEPFASHSWQIAFSFNDEQNELFNDFSQVLQALQAEAEDYEHFFYPVSTTSISLKTSESSNIPRCVNSINEYIRKHTLATAELEHPFDSSIWNQCLINAYFKYCLEHLVMPRLVLTRSDPKLEECLELIGPIAAVNQVKRKFEFMFEIERLKVLANATIQQIDGRWVPSSNPAPTNASDLYNIMLSCCSDDKVLSRHLANRLIEEEYLVLVDYSDKALQNAAPKLNKVDLVLICFSSNYAESANCMSLLGTIKSLSKKYIPVMLTRSSLSHDDDWLQVVNTEELYYELFKEEIAFKLNEELNLEYDKLLINLLRHTKPGEAGRVYEMSNLNGETEKQDAVSDQSGMVASFTPEQIREKELLYEQQLEEIFQQDKIPEDELKLAIDLLTEVVEDFQSELSAMSTDEQASRQTIDGATPTEPLGRLKRQESQSHDGEGEQNRFGKVNESVLATDEHHLINTEQEETHERGNYLKCFMFSAQRWLEKAANSRVIKGNFPPFTLTGDFNDAVFPMPLTNKVPWWQTTGQTREFDHSLSKPDSFNNDLTIGSWCNSDEAHRYFQNYVSKDVQYRRHEHKHRVVSSGMTEDTDDDEQDRDSSQAVLKSAYRHPQFNTRIKKGTTAWDITEDRFLLRAYERWKDAQQSTGKQTKRYSTAWEQLLNSSMQLIVDIKEGRIHKNSNELQGRIGKELKTKAEIKKLNELDDPNNPKWRNQRVGSATRRFIRTKILNTIKWQEFCAAHENSQS